MYGKYIYLYVGERDICVCEGIAGKTASGKADVLVCEIHMCGTPSESVPICET